ncbi:hypothetical protein AB9F41_34840, partial [Rhizobium leguminosarum]|uniref:hypothetical protein n=1 Tax=Rhizobium leguminosarum TaxID=384 RepID=UPI003F9AF681
YSRYGMQTPAGAGMGNGNKEKSSFLWMALAKGKEMMKNFLASLQLQKDNPTLLTAQFRALSSQIPILYVLMIINALAVAITHLKSAPLW